MNRYIKFLVHSNVIQIFLDHIKKILHRRLTMAIIMHVDLDAFFAACEERENPELKGLPVVVGADPKKGRGVVSTANYAARKYGIRSGMPISRAYSLCPAAAFLPVNFRLYHSVSEGVMGILRKYSGRMQQVSIDEAFLDMSHSGSCEKAAGIAGMIKNEIKEKEKITCSIGVGHNKLIAKTASDFQKPDGLTVVKPEEATGFLFPLPVRKLYGVGKKTEAVLRSRGIETIGDLARCDVQVLRSLFGKWGVELHMLSNGISSADVEEAEGIQSIGREYTFEEDTRDVALLHEMLESAAQDIETAMAAESLSARTIVVKVRYENFETHTRQRTLRRLFSDAETISTETKEILKRFTESKKRIRLIGVRVTNLSSGNRQKTMKEFASADAR